MTIAADIVSDFPVGTSKNFTITISLNNEVTDIHLDTVLFRIKENKDDPDSSSLVSNTADVTGTVGPPPTGGYAGIATFTVLPSETASVTPKFNYVYDIVWTTVGGEERVIATGPINLLDRVSDA